MGKSSGPCNLESVVKGFFFFGLKIFLFAGDRALHPCPFISAILGPSNLGLVCGIVSIGYPYGSILDVQGIVSPVTRHKQLFPNTSLFWQQTPKLTHSPVNSVCGSL